MDFNSTIDIIIKDLEEARAIIDDLKKYPGVPALQVELARAKCKSAAEILALLKIIQNDRSGSAKDERSLSGSEEFSPAVKVIDTKKTKMPEESKPPEAAEELKQEGKIILKATIPDAGPEKSNIPEKVYGPEILADRFNPGNDEYLKSRHLISLSDAIGINDRFYFLREIFNNSRDLYVEVISKLDKVHSIEDAKTIIMSYAKDENSKNAAGQLLDLVKRKLRSDE